MPLWSSAKSMEMTKQRSQRRVTNINLQLCGLRNYWNYKIRSINSIQYSLYRRFTDQCGMWRSDFWFLCKSMFDASYMRWVPDEHNIILNHSKKYDPPWCIINSIYSNIKKNIIHLVFIYISRSINLFNSRFSC